MSNVIKDIAQKNHVSFSKQEFLQVESSLKSLKKELFQSSKVVSNDKDIKLIANLINNYADNKNKHSGIFDEQKLKLVKILQRYKEISLSSDIFVYDSNKELLGFVSQEQAGYKSYKATGDKQIETIYFNTQKQMIAPTFKQIKTEFDNALYFHGNANRLYAASATKIVHNNKTVGYLLNQIPLSEVLFSQHLDKKFCLALSFENFLYKSNGSCEIASLDLTKKTSPSKIKDIFTIENKNMFIYSYKPESLKAKLFYIISKDEYYQSLSSMQKQLFIIIFLLSIAIALLSYIFTQKIFISPFKKFYTGFQELQKGNFKYNIKIKSKDELKFLADAFNTMSDTIDRYDKEKTNNYEEVILALVDIIEQRDTYTAGHSKRVAKYCSLIANALGLEKDTVTKLTKAAMLHDIGKIQTPDSVLLKPAKLNDLEYRLIKEHVSISNEILEKLTMYKDLAAIVKYHHERYDGNGYPYGLKEDEIPLLSRIMIVADAFDAMTTNRIYKPRLDVEQAILELKKNSGTQFDPKIVEVAIEAFKDIKITATSDQLPHTEIEKERFAYFFKDKLTKSYNVDYLNIILNKKEYTEHLAYIIMLKNFSTYNQTYGWSEGDKYLISLSHYLIHQYPSGMLFRVEGDDFVFICDHFDKEDLKDFENDIIYLDIVSISLHNIRNFTDIKKLLT